MINPNLISVTVRPLTLYLSTNDEVLEEEIGPPVDSNYPKKFFIAIKASLSQQYEKRKSLDQSEN